MIKQQQKHENENFSPIVIIKFQQINGQFVMFSYEVDHYSFVLVEDDEDGQ